MTIVTLGIDLGKNLNSVVGLNSEGQVVLRRRGRGATLARTSRVVFHPAPLPWRRAGVLIMSVVSLPRKGMMSG